MSRRLFPSLLGFLLIFALVPLAHGQTGQCDAYAPGIPFNQVPCDETMTLSSSRDLKAYLREIGKGHYVNANLVGSITWAGDLKIATACDFFVSLDGQLNVVSSGKGRKATQGNIQVIANNIANMGSVQGDSIIACAELKHFVGLDGIYEVGSNPGSDSEFTFTGGDTMEMDGVIYFPNQKVVVQGGSNSSTGRVEVGSARFESFSDLTLSGSIEFLDQLDLIAEKDTYAAGFLIHGQGNVDMNSDNYFGDDVRVEGRSLNLEASPGLINCIRCNYNGEAFSASSGEMEMEGGQIIASKDISFSANSDNLTLKNSLISTVNLLIVVAKDFITEGNTFTANICEIKVEGQIIGEFICEPPALSPPTNVTAVQIDVGAITVKWEYPPTPNLEGFKIYYGTQSGNYDQEVFVKGTVTETTIRNLPSGTYYLVMTAVSVDGQESEPSEETSTTVR